VVILWLVTLVCGCGARFGALLVWFHFRPHCAGGADGGLLSEWGVLVMIVGLLVNVGGMTETIIVETSCCRVPDLTPEQAVGISHHDGGCSSRRQGDGYSKCLCLRLSERDERSRRGPGRRVLQQPPNRPLPFNSHMTYSLSAFMLSYSILSPEVKKALQCLLLNGGYACNVALCLELTCPRCGL
jgi:hypothetical protein